MKVLVFGCGYVFKALYDCINWENIELVGFVDNHIREQNIFKDVIVYKPYEIVNIEFDYIIIASGDSLGIYNQLLSLDIEKEKILLSWDKSYPYLASATDIVRSHYEYLRLNHLYNKTPLEEGPQIIATGLSYARDALYEPYFSKKIFNLAYPLQDFYYDFELLKMFVNKFKTVKYALIGIGAFSFQHKFNMVVRFLFNKQRYEKFLSRQEYDLNEELKDICNFGSDAFKTIFNDKIIEKLYDFTFLPNYHNGENLFDFYSTVKSNKKISDIKEEHLWNEAKIYARKYMNKNYPQTLKNNISLLEEMVAYSIDNNIKPILVEYPMSIYFNSQYDGKNDMQSRIAVHEIMRKYKVRSVNLRECGLLTDDDFYNTIHINLNGSKKVSALLNYIIETGD